MTPLPSVARNLRMKAWSANVTRIINRMKSALVQLGIRGFKPQLRTAPQLVGTLRTPEDLPIPPNALDEMRRDLARLAVVRQQSRHWNKPVWSVSSKHRRPARTP